ncbi:hypothetical protein B0J14DRAFT_276603 [Halenospora varia]|nr:hypothetical protein B0J14DRAFT_276603 [Halenospora varia]
MIPENRCNALFKQLLDGCNVPADHNAMNFKHGGSLTKGSVTFSVNPVGTRHQPQLGNPKDIGTSCWMWYKGLFNTFDIKGYGGASNDFGKNTLLPKLNNCGVVTGWGFEYYDPLDNPTAYGSQWGYEWHAWGKTIIGQQQWWCIGNAIADAGMGSGGCSGQ